MIKYYKYIFLILIWIIPSISYSFDKSSFIDKDDSMFDVSEFLSSRYGFLPVPIIITEPAVGYGGGFSLVFLHDKLTGKKSKNGRNIPPSITGIFAAMTENKTKLLGGFHIGYYFDDRLRTQTFYLNADVNINFYTKNDNPIFMNVKAPVFYQSLKFRIFDTKLFLGAGYFYTKSKVKLKDTGKIDFPTMNYQTASGSFILDYDNRDTTISPNKGTLLNLRANFYDEFFGSDYKFERYLIQDLLYLPVTENINFDQRFSYEQLVGKDAPFYMYPAVFMRGIPAMRYQGEKSAVYEAQINYDINFRWRALAFIGLAKVFGKTNGLVDSENISFKSADTIFSRGVGFRYLIAKKFGLRVGVDFANTDEDNAVYIQVGTAWLGF